MKDYNGMSGVKYEQPEAIGYTSIEVLKHIWGKPWDEIALAYVHSLRPSTIRVSSGVVHSDARVWRVTVIVNEKDFIHSITQEVEVGLPEGIPHGYALKIASIYGIESEQFKASTDEHQVFIQPGLADIIKEVKLKKP